MKIKVKNDTVTKEEYNEIKRAMNILSGCVWKGSSVGYSVDGTDYVFIHPHRSKQEVLEAIDTIGSLYGIKIEKGVR